MSTVAMVDPGSGRAVIFEGGSPKFYLEHDWTEPKDAKGLHPGMYLQPAMTALEECDAGEYPFTDLHQYLVSSEKKASARSLFLIGTDVSTSSAALRKEALEDAEKLLADSETKEWLTSLMLSKPIPAGSATFDCVPATGHVADIVKAIKEKKWPGCGGT